MPNKNSVSNKNSEDILTKTGLSESELTELREIFQLVDADHGGTISRDELAGLMKTLGLKSTRTEMDTIMNEIDNKGTGEIDFESFVTTVTKKVATTVKEENLIRSFKILDRDDPNHDGTLSMSTFNRIFTEFATEPLSPENAKELITQVAPQTEETDTFDYMQFVSIYFKG